MQQTERFVLLDGIRGIAAIAVLMRHTLPWWDLALFRSYLGVDLFFLLSGFVIGHAYDRRLRDRSIGFAEFVAVRLIRLYPVFALSLLLAGVALVAKTVLGGGTDPTVLAAVALHIALAALFLPVPLPGSVELFTVNGPYWSLFFELLVNFAYAAVRPFVGPHGLGIAVAVAGAVAAGSALAHGHLDLGWTWSAVSLVTGLARAVFGILLGLLLFRHHDALQARVSRIPPSAAIPLVVLVLASPSLGALDPLADLLAVGLLFPLVVVVASRPTHVRLAPLMLMLGSASYPIYVLHKPVGEALHFALGDMVERWAPLSGLLLLAVLLAASVCVERVYDIPVRRWLRTRQRRRAAVALDPAAPARESA
ncbi:acyltransferase family protein [Coralloluteibacterium stylophorae]|uniref:Acyltransferase n=1 Tax=Coralloluteibacterium stylophorae TaxID=1776034 RepID=A0A8J7VWX2_9GAMM|nr:acyltransferase [Coralloluteibacterium stylophorae]MBS7456151.1 acyltransferase [Coralloluteibacterium stylophorae]